MVASEVRRIDFTVTVTVTAMVAASAPSAEMR
jgi:hypothetical protein